MKIIYNPLKFSYRISGSKHMRILDKASRSDVELIIHPQKRSIFGKDQKRRFSRNVKTLKNGESALIRFNRDIANLIFEDFELEFDEYNIPYALTNQKEIWAKWLTSVSILHSKYKGDVVDRLINLMTIKLGDEKSFFEAISNDFILFELYQRHLYKIDFDKRSYTAQRQWTEMALGKPIIFDQFCKGSPGKDGDCVSIDGRASITKNEHFLKILSQRSAFEYQDINTIEQKTIYLGKDLSDTPDFIKSNFIINGKSSILKEVDIELKIEKLDTDEQ